MTDDYTTSACVGLWLFPIAVAIGAAGMPRPLPTGPRCAACQYELVGLGKRGTCPECGGEFDLDIAETARTTTLVMTPGVTLGAEHTFGVVVTTLGLLLSGFTFPLIADLLWNFLWMRSGHSAAFIQAAAWAYPEYGRDYSWPPQWSSAFLTLLAAAMMRYRGVRFGARQGVVGISVLNAGWIGTLLWEWFVADLPNWRQMSLLFFVGTTAAAWAIGHGYACFREARETPKGTA